MANNYFRFKQFIIKQDRCAQKVGTDGVLLGAWVNISNCNNALDIGSGTGLIALMLGQKSIKKIIGIEIDKQAYLQSIENINNSILSSKISIKNMSIQEYSDIADYKFDLIVSNPPFYQHHLKSKDKQKTIARHAESLDFTDLVLSVVKLLNNDGKFCVIIPKENEFDFLIICKKNNLFLNKILNVKPTPTKQIKRVLLELSFNKSEITEDLLIIEEFGRHQYSEKYKNITKDFYINL